MKDKLFTRDFSLVVIGQIISLFGNSILRFALPLYLLNETGSSIPVRHCHRLFLYSYDPALTRRRHSCGPGQQKKYHGHS